MRSQFAILHHINAQGQPWLNDQPLPLNAKQHIHNTPQLKEQKVRNFDLAHLCSSKRLGQINNAVTNEENTVHDRQQLQSLESLHLQQFISEMDNYAVLLLDTNGFIQNWNESNRRILGFESKEVIGKNYALFFTKDDQNEGWPERLLSDADISGRSEFIGWTIRKDNSHFRSKVILRPLRNEASTLLGFTVIHQALSPNALLQGEDQENKAEKKRASLEAEVASSAHDLQAFSYAVSHDLRAPLRAISGYSNILLENYQSILDEDGKNLVNIIVRNVDRVNHLIQGILSHSRLSRKQLHKETIDMNLTFKKVFRQLMSTEPAFRQIDFQLSYLPTAYGDQELIETVVQHLLSNAIKFTRYTIKPKIEIEGRANGDVCEFVVRDNGAGFDERYKDKLFEIFQRLHKEKDFEGSGMGLAMSYQIIKMHGGKIEGSGQPERGATFTMTLPNQQV